MKQLKKLSLEQLQGIYGGGEVIFRSPLFNIKIVKDPIGPDNVYVTTSTSGSMLSVAR